MKTFRIWDGKRYHYPEATKDEANHYLQFGSNGFCLFNEKGKMIPPTSVAGIIQESTPFNDKNGKRIFDCDILSDITMTDEGPKKSHCQVFWCDDTGSWRLDNSFHQNKSSSVLLSSDLKQFEYEISGNIFENPELLVLDFDVKME